MGIFNKIQVTRPSESVFDLSHDNKLSLKMGELVPVLTQECLPGDNWHGQSEAMFRMMPMLAPIMHKVDITTHTFFVPNRILWDNWESFITGGEEGDANPALPVIDLAGTGVEASSLADYMGLPVTPNFGDLVNALPFCAYHRIWYEFYRDQNLETGPTIQLRDGTQTNSDNIELLKIRRRAWEHDYFTSCLPFAQKGAPVSIPMNFADSDVIQRPGASPIITDQAGNPLGALASTIGAGGSGSPELVNNTTGGPADASINPNGTLYIDGDSLNTGTTVNDLRTAFSLQKWLEKNARAGSRYVESLLAHFGVRSSDKRLQRPEYLGGTKSTMAISEVLQTSSTDNTTPQANMAGHGISVSGGRDFQYRCEEHGFLITLLNIKPKTAYYQGLPKVFRKFDRLDYYFPEFAFLGEEEVKNYELYWDDADGLNEGTFGYMPRYSDYRIQSSRVAGQMRTSLEFWHMGRKFSNRPELNREFVTSFPTKRIFAVTDPNEDEIVCHIFHKLYAKRPIPKYGNPGSI